MTYWEGNARYSDGTVITKLRNYRNDVSEADQQYQLETELLENIGWKKDIECIWYSVTLVNE